MKKLPIPALGIAGALLASCGIIKEMNKDDGSHEWSFGQDLAFFAKFGGECVVLGEGPSYVVVSSKWQARVMTSTFSGEDGPGLGWYNRSLIASGEAEKYGERLGGEDVFKIGPEGGDASFYFGGGNIYTEENWKTPAAFSSEPWTLVGRGDTQAKFEKRAEIENAKGTKFKFTAEREISYIGRADIENLLQIELPDTVSSVAYQSLNRITNTGSADWTPEYGMANITVDSFYHANWSTCAFIPYKPGDSAEIGDILRSEQNSNISVPIYKIFPDYVKVRLNAKKIEEVGISAMRSKGVFITYDTKNTRLTVTTYLRPPTPKGYLPNSWRFGHQPGEGDAITVFNNGPLQEGSFFAIPFYRLSTHSPALALPAGKSQLHLQRTFHFHGSEYDLGVIAYKLTGISMKQMRGEEQ